MTPNAIPDAVVKAGKDELAELGWLLPENIIRKVIEAALTHFIDERPARIKTLEALIELADKAISRESAFVKLDSQHARTYLKARAELDRVVSNQTSDAKRFEWLLTKVQQYFSNADEEHVFLLTFRTYYDPSKKLSARQIIDLAMEESGRRLNLDTIQSAHDALYHMETALMAAQACLMGEKPEDMSHEDAKAETLLMVREALLTYLGQARSILDDPNRLLAKKDAEIARLNSMVASLDRDCIKQAEVVDERDARIKVLEKALKPFAIQPSCMSGWDDGERTVKSADTDRAYAVLLEEPHDQ